jgi:hypothetical protein
MKVIRLVAFALLAITDSALAGAGREPVLKQVDLPHSYYWRELYLPQLTTGPSSADFMPDSASLVYSMAGSLWQQRMDSDAAVELTHANGAYDYQPDVASDGSRVVFTRYDGNAMELWRLDFATHKEQQLTKAGAVNVEPRLSPDGKQLVWVSTEGTGHFNLFIADIDASGLHNGRMLLGERTSTIDRYYYSKFDHAINPSWSPDGKSILYVSNPEVAWGTGDIWAVPVADPSHPRRVLREETSWSARPELAPDGKRLLFSSYHGRQSHQLWLSTADGAAPLPLTFGDEEKRNARWSPDGKRIVYMASPGNTELRVVTALGGATTTVVARNLRYLHSVATLSLDFFGAAGQSMPARVTVRGSDGRAYAPRDALMRADDSFDRAAQTLETEYFDCNKHCSLQVPAGATTVVAQHGFAYDIWRGSATLKAGSEVSVPLDVTLRQNALPVQFGNFVSADLHVHMNYGGHYRSTPNDLAAQARAEDLDVVEDLIVNKEQRIPDVARFRTDADPVSNAEVTILHAQEFHTSLWGHLGLLGLQDHYITPDFASYRHTAMASPYPYNGVIADLAHAQGGLVGYVHPFDTIPDPAHDAVLTNELPADVINGKVDYIEIVGFSDHKSTAEVWYRLLNLGFHLPAGAGTDAMTNYASLRGPVGLNRVFLDTGGSHDPEATFAALKDGHGFVSNAPLLGLIVDGKKPGSTIAPKFSANAYRVALRSPVPVDHLELVQNGKVVKSFDLTGDHRSFDGEGKIALAPGSWVVLRAWNDGADPQVLDLYPYATTNPVWVEGTVASDPADAAYFAAWLDRVIEAVTARDDFNDEAEKRDTLDYLAKARDAYRKLGASSQ